VVKARSAIVYTVLRLLAFLVPFGILMLFPIFRELYWLAAIFAALIGLSLSLLFLRRPLEDVTSNLAERRTRARQQPAVSDEDAEDAAADAVERPRSDEA
jgi:ABC-type siderophore export system fused ATPase/permease subunit